MSPEPKQTEPPESAPNAKIAKSSLFNMLAQDGWTCSGRKRNGAFHLALLAVVALLHLRTHNDPWWVLVTEYGCIAVGILVISRTAKYLKPAAQLVLAIVLGLVPWLLDTPWRAMNYGNGMEILMLASFGWIGLGLALFGWQSRLISLAVVASGFLVLFTTFISDYSQSVLFPFIWAALCLWWLVANQWEQVEACQATSVSRSRYRMTSVLIGLLLVTTTFALVSGSGLRVLHQLDIGIMPTSGGSKWNDTAARSGIGSGDAIVAAKEHAMSFGAVETDFFLDSHEPSLFDVFSDQFGEPVAKKKIQKAQALAGKETQDDGHHHFSDANRGGSDEFSIQRDTPKRNKPLDNLRANALMYWQGSSGIRLAVDRFSKFNGESWKKEGQSPEFKQPSSVLIGEQTWFQPSGYTVQNALSPFVDAVPEAMKFTKYRSNIVPTRAGLQLWCVDMLDRADFFGTSDTRCLSMTGREYVPDYTVIRFVDSLIDLQRVRELLDKQKNAGKRSHVCEAESKAQIAQLAKEYTQGTERGWGQVDLLLRNLRWHFALDREMGSKEGEQPLSKFLEQRRGPSYMFVTTAALMLDELGYKTRMARGFYVDPNNAVDGEYSIVPQNAHVWLELHVGSDNWIPLEPAPGFRQPPFRVTWRYRLYQARFAILWFVTGTLLFSTVTYVFRFRIFETLCWLLWPLALRTSDRKRVQWLVSILDWRFRLAGIRRPTGTLPSRHCDGLFQEQNHALTPQVSQLFADADRMYYGPAESLTDAGREALQALWQRLSLFEIKRIHLSNRSTPETVS